MQVKGYDIKPRADLRGADLRKANLRGADLWDADLWGADLCGADLGGANFQGCRPRRRRPQGRQPQERQPRERWVSAAPNSGNANLWDANLGAANFRDADLRDADLRGADLRGADLRGANIRCALGLPPIACPDTGGFIGWKKCSGGVIAKLLIPPDAKRSSATGRKCRTDKAIVLELFRYPRGDVFDGAAFSQHDASFEYARGETVAVDDFDEDRWAECSTGIHFFITREEAERY